MVSLAQYQNKDIPNVEMTSTTVTSNTHLDFDVTNPDDLVSIEKLLKKSPYVKDDILSFEDAEIFTSLVENQIEPKYSQYPQLWKWYSEMSRIRQNWRISKKPDKGKSFIEWAKHTETYLRNQKKTDQEAQLALNAHRQTFIQEHQEQLDDVKTIPMLKKRTAPIFKIEISLEFNQQKLMNINLTELSSNLAIISKAYLTGSAEIKPEKNDEGELSAIIESYINSKDFDIVPMREEIMRNIEAIASVEVRSIKET